MTDTQSMPTRFDDYEVHGVREYGRGKHRYCEQAPDKEARFWSLFGHVPGQGLDCIGDFKPRALAEEIYARITGRVYGKAPNPASSSTSGNRKGIHL